MPASQTLVPAALMALLLTLPTVVGVPDYANVFRSVDHGLGPGTAAGDALPCNREGVTWSHGVVGQPDGPLARAVQRIGPEVCDRISLSAVLSFVRTTDIQARTSDDGELTVRVLLPLIATPFRVPLRNQDPGSAGFVDHAVRDATDAEAASPGRPGGEGGHRSRWVPLLLNPNNPAPCTEGTTRIPASIAVRLAPEWSATAQSCEDVGLDLPGLGAPGLRLETQTGSLAFDPPDRVARVDRLFYLEVAGIVPLDTASRVLHPVFQQAFSNVVLVNNQATETLGNLKGVLEGALAELNRRIASGQQEADRSSYGLGDVVFRVRAFATEAQAALGAPLEAEAVVHGLLALPPQLLLLLPQPPYYQVVQNVAPGAAPGAAEGPAWADLPAALGGCNPSVTSEPLPGGGKRFYLSMTRWNGCLSIEAKTSWGQPFRADGYLVRKRPNGDDHMIASDHHGTLRINEFWTGTAYSSTISYAAQGIPVRNTDPTAAYQAWMVPVWEFSGTTINSCSGGWATPHGCGYGMGAYIAMDGQVAEVDAQGHTLRSAGRTYWSSYGSGGVIWCGEEVLDTLRSIPKSMLWTIAEHLYDFYRCWATESEKGLSVYKHNILGSRVHPDTGAILAYAAAPFTLTQGGLAPTLFRPDSTFTASVCCSEPTTWSGASSKYLVHGASTMRGLVLIWEVPESAGG